MPKTATNPNAGLFIARGAALKGCATDADPVPLVGVTIDGDISSFCARIVISHRYVNREATPIEAVYVFPLDESAAVCGFEAIVDGTLVVGEVQERDKAFERYDDAMAEGHGAFLLDEERPDVFQASIGNLPPGKEVLVRLTYVTELPVDEGRLRFVIPTTVAPRYAPAEDRMGVGRSDEDALNPPTAFSVPYGMNLSLQLNMPGTISAIESPSHPISMKLNGRDATVTLGQQDAALDRDFVLSIAADGLDSPHAMVEEEDGVRDAERGIHKAIGVAFAPKFETTTAPAELIFLVDRSGSMEGTSIQEVRNALQLCLRSMTPGCRFNIVGFGSRFESLFAEGSRPYEQSTLEIATKHVAEMNANLGGTEMLPALQDVLEKPAIAELPRQVVILTDGEVTNTDAMLALVKAHAATARVFAFGIGAGASQHLVRGLARAGGGTAEFIHPGERIEPKVLRQVARLLSPALTDVRVEWSEGSVTQAPAKIPPVFANGRLTVYGFVKTGDPSHARLTANSPYGPLTFDVPLSEAVRSTRTVATLAARARIRELEEGSEWLSARGSQQRERKAQGSNTARDEIIALGIRYGLVSRETSFVAVERRETPVVGEVQLRSVPIALTAGWGGVSQREAERRFVIGSAELLDASAMASGLAFVTPPTASVRLGAVRGFVDRLTTRGVERSSGTVAHPTTPMLRLINLQNADGSWDVSPALAEIIGQPLDGLRHPLPDARGLQADLRRAWATALAVAWLERHAADRADEWRLLADKARRWLDSIGGVPTRSRKWIEAAKAFLEP